VFYRPREFKNIDSPGAFFGAECGLSSDKLARARRIACHHFCNREIGSERFLAARSGYVRIN
jgi:hypothetical protein